MMGKGRYDHVQRPMQHLSLSVPAHCCLCLCLCLACCVELEMEVSRYPRTQQSISPLPQLFVGSYHRPKRHGELGPGQPALNACGTGVHAPSLCSAIAHLSGRWQGPGAPNPGPQPAALVFPQRETGSEKRKKIARRKLPNIGPLLHHHHQPLSQATRAHSLSHSLPPSSSHLLNSPPRRPIFSPGPLEQSKFPPRAQGQFPPVLSSVSLV